MGVVEFSRVAPGASVVEVGAGTGSFLALFDDVASQQIGIDLTPGMLAELTANHPRMGAVVADGARLPLRSRSVDLVTSAQTLHHMHAPLPVIREMRRVMAPGGRILIVDQVAP